MKVKVFNWIYRDGWEELPSYFKTNPVLTNDKFYTESLIGWYCQVYTSEVDQFQTWMKNNMKGQYSSDFRYNSGDPSFFVHIRLPEDATLFKLTWL